MTLNVTSSLYRRKHRLLKSSLPRQNWKNPRHLTLSALALPNHVPVPAPNITVTSLHRNTTSEGFSVLFCEKSLEKRPYQLWCCHLGGLEVGQGGKSSWLLWSSFLAEILAGVMSSQRKILSWNCQYTPIPEVNHEAPDKERHLILKKNSWVAETELPKYPG